MYAYILYVHMGISVHIYACLCVLPSGQARFRDKHSSVPSMHGKPVVQQGSAPPIQLQSSRNLIMIHFSENLGLAEPSETCGVEGRVLFSQP